MRYLGDLVNNSHKSTPVVLGDAQLITRWSGTDDDVGVVSVDGGEVYLPDLEARGPSVFVGDGEVWLVSEGNTFRELSAWLDCKRAPEAFAKIEFEEEEDERGELSVPSGNLLIALAYQTPKVSSLPTKASKISDELFFVPLGATTATFTIETASAGTNALPIIKRSILPIEDDEEPIVIRCRIRAKRK